MAKINEDKLHWGFVMKGGYRIKLMKLRAKWRIEKVKKVDKGAISLTEIEIKSFPGLQRAIVLFVFTLKMIYLL
jgi:hypothetical protein